MQKTNVWTPRGKGVDGRNWEIGIDITLTVYKADNWEEPIVQHRELSLMFCGDQNGKEIQNRGDTYIYIYGWFILVYSRN